MTDQPKTDDLPPSVKSVLTWFAERIRGFGHRQDKCDAEWKMQHDELVQLRAEIVEWLKASNEQLTQLGKLTATVLELEERLSKQGEWLTKNAKPLEAVVAERKQSQRSAKT